MNGVDGKAMTPREADPEALRACLSSLDRKELESFAYNTAWLLASRVVGEVGNAQPPGDWPPWVEAEDREATEARYTKAVWHSGRTEEERYAAVRAFWVDYTKDEEEGKEWADWVILATNDDLRLSCLQKLHDEFNYFFACCGLVAEQNECLGVVMTQIYQALGGHPSLLTLASRDDTAEELRDLSDQLNERVSNYYDTDEGNWLKVKTYASKIIASAALGGTGASAG